MALHKNRSFTATGFDYFCSWVTYSEMLETVIKFHRLKYVRGKNKKTWLTMVLESIGSVAGERKAVGWGLLKAAFGRDGRKWEKESTLCHHLLLGADVVPWERKESKVKSDNKKRKNTPKWTVWPRGEKLDTNHLMCTHPHPRHTPETQGGWLSFETDYPITPQRL